MFLGPCSMLLAPSYNPAQYVCQCGTSGIGQQIHPFTATAGSQVFLCQFQQAAHDDGAEIAVECYLKRVYGLV